MKMENGWYSIDEHTYHQKLDAVGSTTLNNYLRSAAHAQYEKEQAEVDKEVRFGSLVHSALLEPTEFQRYQVIPKCDRRTKEGKAIYADFLSTLPDGAKIVTKDDYEKALNIRNSLCSHPTYSSLLSKKGFAELSGIYHDYKIRPDYRYESEVIIDIKTTADARLQNFDRQILQYGYDLQAAFYLDVANMICGKKEYRTFIWVVIEAEPPHCVAFYEVSNEWLELGREKYKKALEIYFEARQKGVYRGYSNEIITAMPPAYAMYF